MNKIILILTLLYLTVSTEASLNNRATDPWKEMNKVLRNIKTPKFRNKAFLITDFGAKEGIEDYSNNSINKAINFCHSKGGGKVIVPKGVFYTGPITLKSNVNLHLSEGAILKFSTNPALYVPYVYSRWEGWDCINLRPLIYAYKETNIAVTGKGILDGQANNENWWPWKGRTEYGWKTGMISQEWNGTKENGGRNRLSSMEEQNIPWQIRIMTEADRLRPAFIEPQKCKNILFEGFTIINSPFWLLHPLMSENIIVRGLTLKSHGPNNDGCDPESCKNVLIEDCLFDTGDDCIAIKSGKNNDGRKWGIPSENIIVRNCTMKEGHGGVVLGSEISGNVRNVWVENCRMDSPNLERVIRIKSNPIRGGLLENFFIRNIEVGECSEAIFRVEMKYEKVFEGPNLPLVKNFIMENVHSKKSKYGIFIDGLENTIQAQVQNVVFRNCSFENVQIPYKITGAKGITFDNVIINNQSVSYIPKK
jgi:polygalacturonase